MSTTGTFTPTISFGGNSVDLTYAYQSGFYVTDGNFVICNFRAELSDKGSSTGTLVISGFPFAAANQIIQIPITVANTTLDSGYSTFVISMTALDTTGTMAQIGSGLALAVLTDANCSNSSAFDGTITYQLYT